MFQILILPLSAWMTYVPLSIWPRVLINLVISIYLHFMFSLKHVGCMNQWKCYEVDKLELWAILAFALESHVEEYNTFFPFFGLYVVISAWNCHFCMNVSFYVIFDYNLFLCELLLEVIDVRSLYLLNLLFYSSIYHFMTFKLMKKTEEEEWGAI